MIPYFWVKFHLKIWKYNRKVNSKCILSNDVSISKTKSCPRSLQTTLVHINLFKISLPNVALIVPSLMESLEILNKKIFQNCKFIFARACFSCEKTPWISFTLDILIKIGLVVVEKTLKKWKYVDQDRQWTIHKQKSSLKFSVHVKSKIQLQVARNMNSTQHVKYNLIACCSFIFWPNSESALLLHILLILGWTVKQSWFSWCLYLLNLFMMIKSKNYRLILK